MSNPAMGNVMPMMPMGNMANMAGMGMGGPMPTMGMGGMPMGEGMYGMEGMEGMEGMPEMMMGMDGEGMEMMDGYDPEMMEGYPEDTRQNPSTLRRPLGQEGAQGPGGGEGEWKVTSVEEVPDGEEPAAGEAAEHDEL